MSKEDKDEAEEGSQSIFDLFEPPPEAGPNSFGKVPVVRGEDATESDNAELTQKMAAAEAEAAGLQHWTEPASGKMPAAFEATRSQRIEREALRPSWQGDEGGWDGPDLTEALESIDEMEEDGLDAIVDVAPEPIDDVSEPESLDTVQELGWDRDDPSPVADADDSDVVDPSEGRIAPSTESGPSSAVARRDGSTAEPRTGRSDKPFEPTRPGGSDVAIAPVPAPAPASASRERSADNVRLLDDQPTAANEVVSKPDADVEDRKSATSGSATTAPGSASASGGTSGISGTGTAASGRAPTPPALRARTDTPDQSDAPTAPGLFADRPDDTGVFGSDGPALDLTDGAASAAPAARSASAPSMPSVGRSGASYSGLLDDDKPGRNIPQAIAVGVALGAVVLVAMALGPVYILGVVALVALLAVVELYNAMRIAGLRPANLLGIFGAVALPLAAYYRGDSAFTLVLALSLVFGMLWYIVGADSERPVLNLSLTLLGVAWVGGLGGFAGLILRNDRGVQYLASTILMVVVFDTLAYFGGRAFGSRPFHRASPNKTWEGTLAGFVGSVFTGAALWATPLSFIDMWSDELTAALALGAAVGIAAPIGDLAESLVKRDLGIKDMGTILPGHGGVLDRIDGLLFALPTAYYLALSLRFVWE